MILFFVLWCLAHTAVTAKEFRLSKALLVGGAINIDHVYPAGDVQIETAGHLKPLLKVSEIPGCTFDERRARGQTSVLEMHITQDVHDFSDTLAISASLEIGFGKFHGKISGAIDNADESGHQKTIIHRKQTLQTGTVTLNTECLADSSKYTKSFGRTLATLGTGLPQYYFESEREKWKAYLEFLDGYGSHVVTGATYGYAFDALITFDKNFKHYKRETSGDLVIDFESDNAEIHITANFGIKKLAKSTMKNLKVKASIMGGGLLESADLVKAADEFFSDPDRAALLADGSDSALLTAADGPIIAFNDAVNKWAASCAADSDTSRPVSAVTITLQPIQPSILPDLQHYMTWRDLLKSNVFPGVTPLLLDDLDRAVRVHSLLSWRKHCAVGSWDTRALKCESNPNNKHLGKRRVIKASNGKYAFYDPTAREMKLIDDRLDATHFIFVRRGEALADDVAYGLHYQDKDGKLFALHSLDRKSLFGSTSSLTDTKSGFQFVLTSKGAIALVPSRPSQAGSSPFKPITTFLQSTRDRLEFRYCAHEPDHEHGDDFDLTYFFSLEDPTTVSMNDGRGGTSYQGGMSASGKFHGKGLLKWGNGNTYKGHFMMSVFHGSGILSIPEIGLRYEGQFNNGRIEGSGTLMDSVGMPIIEPDTTELRWVTSIEEGTWKMCKLENGLRTRRFMHGDEEVYDEVTITPAG